MREILFNVAFILIGFGAGWVGRTMLMVKHNREINAKLIQHVKDLVALREKMKSEGEKREKL